MCKTMYDIIIVGAGLTAATICALLKNKYKIVVLDVRDHIAGNCYDYVSNGTMIHKYGPHIFHSPNMSVVDLLSCYTEWIPYKHKVSAQLSNGSLVPFPYSNETSNKIGKKLSEDEVIDTFFKSYSIKMWGRKWEDLPDVIRNRIPKDTNETSDYFVNQFTAFPKDGYTKMIERMMVGVDVILGVAPNEWMSYIGCGTIVYCGRPDLVTLKNGLKAGGVHGDWLEYRNIDFTFKPEPWDAPTPVVNFCNLNSIYTRKSCFKDILGGNSSIVTYEKPTHSTVTDVSPFYFYPSQENTSKSVKIKNIIKECYPNMILAGRLGTSTYIDMWNCVQMGITIATKLN